MTTIVAIQGIRGGCGATSVCASLAWALAQQEHSVLVVDFSFTNLLRLSFNQPYEENNGWALNITRQAVPMNAINYAKGIDYLPFGLFDNKTLSSFNNWLIEQKHRRPNRLPDEMSFLSFSPYDWILIDCSSTLSSLTELAHALVDINIFTLNADLACQVLLKQKTLPTNSYFLLNRFMATSLLQQDISHVWQQSLAGFIPVILHSDEALAEALALKKPVGESHPHSLISQDINKLAEWCLNPNKKDG